MNPTVAIVAQGAMGSAVGKRLVERGLSVSTSLAGRSEASAKRARAAGMTAASDEDVARAACAASRAAASVTSLAGPRPPDW